MTVAAGLHVLYVNVMHTYSIIRDSAEFNLNWTGINAPTYGRKCNCGVMSGVSHQSIDAAHREPSHLHALNSNRRIGNPVFDGQIIDRY